MYLIKKRLILWLTKKLLPVIDERDAIAFNKQGEIFLGGEKATQHQVNNLKEEVKFLKETELWRVMNTYLNKVAEKRIITESKDFTDVIVGKVMLYTFDVQQKIIEKIEKLK